MSRAVAAIVFAVAFLGGLPVTARAAEPVVYYDATPLLALPLEDAAQRRRLWDETHLLTSLQGLVNRSAPRLFLRYVRQPDDFWWNEMTREGGWMAGRKVERVTDLQELLRRFARHYRGAVVWDPRVPATSNVASTVAGVEGLLCLRYDTAPGSLYRRLTEGEPRLRVRVRLLAEDGGPLFTGRGTVPGTEAASTGSAKCDAYVWLIERYVKTGKANPGRMGYYLDGAWLDRWRASGPENHTLTNHDFVISRKGVLFDLGVWDDETPVDDPGQKPGTDAATLKALLRAAYDRQKGTGVIHVAGFVPWAFKYTRFVSAAGSAGGTHPEVPTEWRYAEILSCYNAYMDADALGLCAMANASFFQHYPLKRQYTQPAVASRAELTRQGILDAEGRIVPRRYVAHYVGDYDAAAWLYQQLPRMWTDPARGTTPLSWAFNPNLADRFPLGMAWARERATPMDRFVAGDSGAGYLNPGNLTPPREHSGLPSGLAAWEAHCRKYYRQWGLDVTGFIIDGFAPEMAPETLDAYARFSSGGIVGQKVPRQAVHKGMPILRMMADIAGSPADAARAVIGMTEGSTPRFAVFRSILHTPTWYADVERELRSQAGDSVRVVDLPTLLWLAREHLETADKRPSAYRDAREVGATPGAPKGLTPVYHPDGPFDVVDRDGVRAWRVAPGAPAAYLYMEVDDGFRAAGRALDVTVEYLHGGDGRLVLEYDSTDRSAPLEGAYTPHPDVVERPGPNEWRTVTWRVANPRFEGRQNSSADFRLTFNAGELLVRSVTVRRVD